jgi:hypothetical protein
MNEERVRLRLRLRCLQLEGPAEPAGRTNNIVEKQRPELPTTGTARSVAQHRVHLHYQRRYPYQSESKRRLAESRPIIWTDMERPPPYIRCR